MGPEDDNFEDHDCQQAATIADPVDEAERRRFMALDQAIRVSDHTSTTESILKAASAFDAFLKGE